VNRRDRWLVRLTTNRVATWLIRHVASPLDPLIFRASGGRLTSIGPPAMPMLTVTARGRHSGRPRSVQLAYLERDDGYLVVASAMGQQRHPAWRYNLEANPEVEVQLRGERVAARAELLSDEEKEEVWPRIREAIPQMNVYETRTDRNIRVFRLRRIASEG
jgi:deazaflavin-dependent oxidoreductase (nitroreductase family)